MPGPPVRMLAASSPVSVSLPVPPVTSSKFAAASVGAGSAPLRSTTTPGRLAVVGQQVAPGAAAAVERVADVRAAEDRVGAAVAVDRVVPARPLSVSAPSPPCRTFGDASPLSVSPPAPPVTFSNSVAVSVLVDAAARGRR